MEIISALSDALDDVLSIFSDDIYAEKLQFQEALQASYLSPSPSHILDHASSSRNTSYSCEICMEDKQKPDIFEIKGCPHSFCSFCVTKHIEYKLQDNVVFITCPSEGCDNIIQPGSLRSIVPLSVVERWEEAMTESSILDSQKFYCPYKDCSELLVNDEEGVVVRESECPRCWRLFCAQCKVPWHDGFDCKGFRKMNSSKSEKKMLRLLAKKNNWTKCPNCKMFVDKTEGCIHITCRCKFEFCYTCGSNWKESHWNTCQNSSS